MSQLSRAEFFQLYHDRIKPRLLELEERRKQIKRIIIISAVVILVIDFFIIGFFSINSRNASGVVHTISCIIFMIIYAGYFNQFHRDFKRNIILPVINGAFPKYHYSPTSIMSVDFFNKPGTFKYSANKLRSDDQISGVVHKTKFRMTEVLAQYETGSGKDRRVHTVFKGFMFELDFHKNFNSHTIIRPEKAKGLLGKFFNPKLQSLKHGALKLVKMEDSRFEKKFVVYSNNQQDARYILSPKLMERIIKVRQKFKTDLYLAFYQNQFILYVSRYKNYFEPKLFSTIVSFKDFREIYDIIDYIDDMIEVMDLNTRIWTKD